MARSSTYFAYEHRSCRITCTKGADKTGVTRRQVLIMLVESNDGTGERRVGLGAKNGRALVVARLVPKHPLRNEPVHAGIRLMQP